MIIIGFLMLILLFLIIYYLSHKNSLNENFLADYDKIKWCKCTNFF